MNMIPDLLSTDPVVSAACKTFAVPERVRATTEEVAVLSKAQKSEFDVGNDQIVCWTFGTGPRVLLVHGWCSRGSHLMSFVQPLLSAGFSVALFDAAGHGDSGGEASSMIHAGRAAIGVAELLGNIHGVISHSGGSTAALWAFANGLIVDKSVHFCGPVSMKRIVNEIAIAHGLDYQQTRTFQKWVEAFTGVGLDSADLPNFATALTHPGLIVHDSTDRVVNFSEAKILHSVWTNSRLVITEGLGHRRILSDPYTVTTAVEFIAH